MKKYNIRIIRTFDALLPFVDKICDVSHITAKGAYVPLLQQAFDLLRKNTIDKPLPDQDRKIKPKDQQPTIRKQPVEADHTRADVATAVGAAAERRSNHQSQMIQYARDKSLRKKSQQQ